MKRIGSAYRIIVFFLVLFFANTIFAQRKYTISGYIRDIETGETLAGASISDQDHKGSITNTYGFYSFNVDTNIISLSISYLGYTEANFLLNLNKDTVLNIDLRASTTVLSTVEIRANALKFSKLKDLGVVGVSSEQLKYVPSMLGERDVFKYFQLQPGVNPGKEGSAGLHIRGGSADQTLILMDDVPIYNSAHAFGFVSVFSGDYIKSADLYKSYTPSQYGGRLSGVTSMNIKDGNRNSHEQSLQLGTLTLSGLIEGPINKGKGSYLAAARFFTPAPFLKLGSLFIPGFFNLGFYDVTTKIVYDIGKKTKIYGSFYAGRDDFGFTVNEDDNIYKYKSGVNLGWGNIVGAIRLSSELNNKTFLNATTYYSYLQNRNKINYNEILKQHNKESFSINSLTKSKLGEAGLKIHLTHNIYHWYTLSYGYNFAYQRFIPQTKEMIVDSMFTKMNYGERHMFTNSVYADNTFSYGRFSLNIGGRLNLYTNNNESVFIAEPRTSLTYKMPKFSIWLSYIENSQALFSTSQQYFNLPVDYWVPFQNAKEIPRSRQISLGYKHGFDFGFEFQIEAYYKRSRKIALIYDIDDFLLENEAYDLAEGEAFGGEFIGQYSYMGFNVMLSYTYSKSIYDIKGKKVPFMFDTPHHLNLLASYITLNKNNKKHTVSVNLSYKTGLPYIYSNEYYPSIDNSNDLINYPKYANVRLQDFFRIDLNYTMEKKLKKGSRVWQFSLLNATAYKNPYVIYPVKDKYKAFMLLPILPSFSYIRKF